MRYITKATIILIAIGLCAASCKNDDDDGFSAEDSMAEYFRCKINGEEFRSQGDWTCSPNLFDYYPESINGVEAGYLVLRGRNCIDERRIGLRFREATPQLGEFSFLEPAFADSAFPFYSFKPNPNELNRTIEQLVNGSINFIRFEPRVGDKLGTVEGTFNFTVRDTIDQIDYNITEGEFRFRIQHSW